MTLAANQATSFNVKFAPTNTGSVSGSVKVMTDAAHRPAMLPLKGSGSDTTPQVSTVQVSPEVSTPARWHHQVRGADPGRDGQYFGYVVCDDRHDHDRLASSRRRWRLESAGLRLRVKPIQRFSASATVAVAGKTVTPPDGGTGSGSGGTDAVTAVSGDSLVGGVGDGRNVAVPGDGAGHNHEYERYLERAARQNYVGRPIYGSIEGGHGRRYGDQRCRSDEVRRIDGQGYGTGFIAHSDGRYGYAGYVVGEDQREVAICRVSSGQRQ